MHKIKLALLSKNFIFIHVMTIFENIICNSKKKLYAIWSNVCGTNCPYTKVSDKTNEICSILKIPHCVKVNLFLCVVFVGTLNYFDIDFVFIATIGISQSSVIFNLLGKAGFFSDDNFQPEQLKIMFTAQLHTFRTSNARGLNDLGLVNSSETVSN